MLLTTTASLGGVLAEVHRTSPYEFVKSGEAAENEPVVGSERIAPGTTVLVGRAQPVPVVPEWFDTQSE